MCSPGSPTVARRRSSKLADLPGGTKALKAINDLRERVDELGKKVRGIDGLEARIAALEKELAALKRQAKPAATRAQGSRREASRSRPPEAARPLLGDGAARAA